MRKGGLWGTVFVVGWLVGRPCPGGWRELVVGSCVGSCELGRGLVALGEDGRGSEEMGREVG